MADDCLPETCEDDTSDDTCIVVDNPSNSRTSSRRVKSEVWEFFVKKDKSALCKICNKEYAYHGGTSNLRDHLMRAHPSKLKSPPNQPSLHGSLFISQQMFRSPRKENNRTYR